MFAPQVSDPEVVSTMAYGYGWIIMDELGRKIVGHGGAIDGFRADILRFPDERITIIILSNQEDSLDTMTFIWRSLTYGMITIETEDGAAITYAGPLEAQAGRELQTSFMVTDPSGQPAKGLLFATLGESSMDSAAVRTSLTIDGIAVLFLPVDLPTGTSTLYCKFNGVDYEVARITISP